MKDHDYMVFFLCPKTLWHKTVGADEHSTEGDVNMADNNEQNVSGGENTTPEATGTQTTIDYDKIQKIVDNATAKKESLGLQVELAATKEAMNLGISGKTLEYVLRMADMSKAVGEDGKVSQEAVKARELSCRTR